LTNIEPMITSSDPKVIYFPWASQQFYYTQKRPIDEAQKRLCSVFKLN